MATYVNDLRLKEIATGDESGTWGTSTNTNLELIGEALGFGTEAITTNANTHDSTVGNGSSSPARAMYIKYTGTLDSACTITIGPNTNSRVQFIENGTSGSQNIIISQGSGANVTIAPGKTKIVYLTGAGGSSAVVDALALLENFLQNGAAGSLSQLNITAQGDLRLEDSSGGQYIALQAPSTVSTNVTLTLPADDGDADQVLSTNGSGVLAWSPSGVTLDTTVRTSAFTAVAGNTYMINTSSASFNITLPGSPTVGKQVGFMDVNSTFDVNSATLLRNGVKLFNATADGAIDIKGYAGTLVYTGTTYGWMPMS